MSVYDHALRYAAGDDRVDVTLEPPGASISLWWASKNEWPGLIDVAALEVEARYEDFECGTLTDESREYVWVARRPA